MAPVAGSTPMLTWTCWPRAGQYLPSTTGASKHQATALPSGQGMGRAAAFPGRRHTLVANEKEQPTGLPRTPSSPSMTSYHLHVVSHGVAQHPYAAVERGDVERLQY